MTVRQLVDVLRYDFGKLGKIRRTGAGAVRVDATLTRTGVFVYRNPDGSERREYRPPDEVFNADSIASAEGVPVTIRHPGIIDPSNVSELRHGFVVDGVSRSGAHLKGTLQLDTAEIQGKVNRGDLKEISMGYRCKMDMTPGVTPGGEKYDCVQRQILYNHSGLGPAAWGRMGPEASLHLDSDAEDQVFQTGLRLDQSGNIAEQQEEETVKIKIDGKLVDFGSEEHINLIEREHADELAKVNAEVEKQTGRADAAEGKLSQAEKAIKEASDPTRLDAMVAERTQVCAVAQGVIGEKFDAAGKTNHAIMLECLTVADPEFKADASEGYVSGAFGFLASKLSDPGNPEGSSWSKAKRQDNTEAKKTAEDLELNTAEKRDAKFKEDTENAWTGKLALSK